MTSSDFFFGGQKRYFYSAVVLILSFTKALQKQVLKNCLSRVTEV